MNWPAFLDIPETVTQIIGVDEVGRGALAGPMTLGFCQISVADMMALEQINYLNDSKKLSANKRQAIIDEVLNQFDNKSLRLSSDSVGANQIDELGIRNCYLHILNRLVSQIDLNTTLILADFGIPKPYKIKYWTSVKKGDATIPTIALASIYAKQERDLLMKSSVHDQFTSYGFDTHVGYATKKHRLAIQENGLTKFHRQSFCTKIYIN